MKKSVAWSVLALVLCVCSELYGQNTGNGAIRFKTHKCIDTQGIGTEAFRILVPEGWQFDGGLRWRLDNPGIPVEASFQVWNPQGSQVFEVFPNLPFFWTNNQMTLSMFPPGSRYFGNAVGSPVGALDALRQIVLPRFRSNAPGLRIVKQEHLPDLAGALGRSAQSVPGVMSVQTDGAKMRIEYNQRGSVIEEEIYCVVASQTYQIQSMYGPTANTNWTVDPIFSFRAEKGRLDANARLFQTIAYSFTLDLQWFNKYNQLVYYLIQQQIQRIHSIGEISRILSQTHNEISDIMMQSYNERQAVNDRIADKFSQYVRGIDKYYDPVNQKAVELPTGYDNAWTNGIGDYIVSDSPSYNPNVESNQNWQRMKRQN